MRALQIKLKKIKDNWGITTPYESGVRRDTLTKTMFVNED